MLPSAFPYLSTLQTLISFHTESKMLFNAINIISKLHTEIVLTILNNIILFSVVYYRSEYFGENEYFSMNK